VALGELAADIAESETLAAGEGGVEIVSEVPPGMMLRADPEQLFRIVMNLVRNARQAIAATGKPGRVAISASEEDEAWLITVADTGPGLPKKAQDNLFTPFQGGARKGGTGLGLAIAGELARGHGGSVMLKDTGPEGTVFEICLPKGDGAR
jgi:signal transduction histidine kinase